MTRLLLPLRHRPMALLWGGLALSSTGDQLYVVALAWVSVRLLGADAGYLSALQSAVLVLAALLGGLVLDRVDERRAMVGADLSRAAALALLVGAWMASGRPSLWLLLLCVIVLAIGRAAFQPAMQSVIPELTPDRALLPAANGLLDATDRVARLLGPGLVGLLAGIVPVSQFFSLDGASFLASAVAVLLIGRAGACPRPPHAPRHPFAVVAHGFRAVARERLLLVALCISGPVNGAWYTAMFLALPYGFAAGGGIGRYGAVLTAYGVTNLLSNLVIGGRDVLRHPTGLLLGGEALVGVGMGLMGVAERWASSDALVPLCAAAAALGAIGGPMNDITHAVLRQTRLKGGDLPAAMRAYLVASSSGLVVAMLLAPGLLRAHGYASVTIGAGAVIVAASLAAIPFLALGPAKRTAPNPSTGSRG